MSQRQLLWLSESAGTDLHFLLLVLLLCFAACLSPIVAGAVAMMLEVRPDLGWRDVQGVLIHSAKPINQADPEWQTNGAHLRVSHKYGFGRLDCAQVITTANTWTKLGPEVMVRTGMSTVYAIPDATGQGLQVPLEIDQDLIVESVEVSVNIEHGYRGQLVIQLESPMATSSILQEAHSDANQNIYWTYTSMRHWGENARGYWKLSIFDRTPGFSGSLEAVVISVYGHRR
jgi:subtilisin-like proprotein convertase family protein